MNSVKEAKTLNHSKRECIVNSVGAGPIECPDRPLTRGVSDPFTPREASRLFTPEHNQGVLQSWSMMASCPASKILAPRSLGARP